jgi:hypothetical protein
MVASRMDASPCLVKEEREGLRPLETLLYTSLRGTRYFPRVRGVQNRRFGPFDIIIPQWPG